MPIAFKPGLPLAAVQHPAVEAEKVLAGALGDMNELEDLQSVKQECDNLEEVAKSAGDLTLFNEDLMKSGVVELDSSSGSSSDDSSSSDSSEQELQNGSIIKDFPEYSESVPEGLDFHRHVKSCIVHCCVEGKLVTKCKLQISAKYKKLERVFHVKFPKCLKCFPKDHNRLRSVDDLTKALDESVKRSKTSRS